MKNLQVVFLLLQINGVYFSFQVYVDVTGRYCGSGRIYEPIISAGSRMLITYITSGASDHRGFKAVYEGKEEHHRLVDFNQLVG